ncbi:BspA family leucine-rich repeat surface protein [archaeon]|nr:MAG: BspA family leucine-rich repeat surface protein [archaeon]
MTSLSGMFQGASSFNLPIAQWDVSKVTIMALHVLQGQGSLNQSIGQWLVGKV